MKIYTRTGDDGTTSLAGGERIPKNSYRLEAYGTVDELISWMGVIAALPENTSRIAELTGIQDKLMHCAALLSLGKGARTDRIMSPGKKDIEKLEQAIDRMEKDMDQLTSFILPGGSLPVAWVHVTRTVCRRAERYILRIDDDFTIDKLLLKYINRLSDYLFMLSRRIEFETGKNQLRWNT